MAPQNPITPIASQTAGINGVVDINSLSKIKTLGGGKQARAEAVASQLESVFWGMMLKSMRDTVPEGGLLGKGLGGQNYVEMLDQQLPQMQGMPRDPRFHEALVKQIMQNPGATDKAMATMHGDAAAKTAANSANIAASAFDIAPTSEPKETL